jgi:hypothetical protein
MHRHVGRPPRRLAAFTGILLTLSAFADTPDTTLDSILASLAERRHGHAVYSEQIESALFKRPLHTSGELFFDAPTGWKKGRWSRLQKTCL